MIKLFVENQSAIVFARDLRKKYQRGREEIEALAGVSFTIKPGEFVAIVGPSGAGKTTLLNLIGCMDAPTAGELRIASTEVSTMNDQERTRFRREQIGFVFQHFGLIPTLTVAENVALPLLFSGSKRKDRVRLLLERVDLWGRRNHKPSELSGGEMQRVAIARALVNEPKMILADEPTGNLDSEAGRRIIDLFRELQRGGLTIVIVTHNEAFAALADRQIHLRDGKCVESFNAS